MTTAHVDTFARDHLPPRDQWPELQLRRCPSCSIPDALNCATELLDARDRARLGRRAPRSSRPDGVRWTYAELLAQANRIAHVLRRGPGARAGQPRAAARRRTRR